MFKAQRKQDTLDFLSLRIAYTKKVIRNDLLSDSLIRFGLK